MDTRFNSHGCIPGIKCRCPKTYHTCSAWENLFNGIGPKDYHSFIAFRNGDEQLDRMGWDMVCEAVAEADSVEMLRAMWRSYSGNMVDALVKRSPVQARFWAWAMLEVEKAASKR